MLAVEGAGDANRKPRGTKARNSNNNNTLELQRSTPLHLHVYTPAAHLQSAIPPCVLHVPTPAAPVQSSRSPYLFASTPARLQRTSRPLLRQRPQAHSMSHEMLAVDGTASPRSELININLHLYHRWPT